MASDKIVINYFQGGQFVPKEVNTGTTVSMLKTQEEHNDASVVSVNKINRDNDYLFEADDYVSVVTNNKTGG